MSEDPPVSFASDIKPLFRSFDRDSMIKGFDLWSYDDVVTHKDAILAELRAGSMPCDGAWSADKVRLLEQWIKDGAQP